MKLVTYQHANRVAIGAVEPDGILDLSAVAPDMLGLIDGGLTALERARAIVRSGTTSIPIEQVTFLAPIPSPRRNMMCVGLNYAGHAKESAEARGREYRQHAHPVFFTKATHTINRHAGTIPFDAKVSKQIDWEAELGVILGRAGKDIAVEQALDYVFGYTCINDVTARDLQSNHSQYFKGKSLDGACPIGPWIVTTDEIADPQRLRITCRVNGVTKQDGNTAQMIFKVADIIAILSRGMTLDAGDIIATGTPDGVGFARTPPEFLKPGDWVEVEIERIGLLQNRVGAD